MKNAIALGVQMRFTWIKSILHKHPLDHIAIRSLWGQLKSTHSLLPHSLLPHSHFPKLPARAGMGELVENEILLA